MNRRALLGFLPWAFAGLKANAAANGNSDNCPLGHKKTVELGRVIAGGDELLVAHLEYLILMRCTECGVLYTDELKQCESLERMATTAPAPHCPVCGSYKLQCRDGHSWDIPATPSSTGEATE